MTWNRAAVEAAGHVIEIDADGPTSLPLQLIVARSEPSPRRRVRGAARCSAGGDRLCRVENDRDLVRRLDRVAGKVRDRAGRDLHREDAVLPGVVLDAEPVAGAAGLALISGTLQGSACWAVPPSRTSLRVKPITGSLNVAVTLNQLSVRVADVLPVRCLVQHHGGRVGASAVGGIADTGSAGPVRPARSVTASAASSSWTSPSLGWLSSPRSCSPRGRP